MRWTSDEREAKEDEEGKQYGITTRTTPRTRRSGGLYPSSACHVTSRTKPPPDRAQFNCSSFRAGPRRSVSRTSEA